MAPLNPLDVAKERRHRYHTFARAYDRAASEMSDRGRRLAVLTATLSAIVSSAIFTSLTAGDVPSYWKWITGGLSLTGTLAAAISASLSYSDSAADYRKAALKCVELQHRAEELIAGRRVTLEDLTTFDIAAAEAEAAMKIVPDRFYRDAEAYCDLHRSSDVFEHLSSSSEASG